MLNKESFGLRKIFKRSCILVLWVLLAACSRKSTPQGVVETYLKALVDKDETTLITLTCGDWEPQALLEYDSFSSVATSLEELSCASLEEQDQQASVNCSGTIQATYGNETRQFDLQDRVYKVVHQGDNWLVCGYDRK
jgi:hypothetical protein